MPETDTHGVQGRCLHTTYLDAPPSCIEFSPHHKDTFVVGTYSLLEGQTGDGQPEPELSEEKKSNSQARTGSLLLLKLQYDYSVVEIGKIDISSAVLDLHFSPHDHDLLAVADSTGSLHFYRLDQSASHLQKVVDVQLFDDSTLILSLAWNPAPTFKDEIAVTLSTGEVVIVKWMSNDQLGTMIGRASTERSFDAHSLEAWTVSWAPDADYVFSGGDDSVTRTWNPHISGDEPITIDERRPEDVEFEKHLRNDASPLISIPGTLTDSRSHSAGVTAILPLPSTAQGNENLIVTGSYDEVLRILLPGPGRRWKTLAEKGLGGGVWRLKLLQSRLEGLDFSVYILASCMHAGPKIVNVSRVGDEWDIRVVAWFDNHDSMNYGSDAVPSNEDGKWLVASTSFYDRKLCIWTWQ